MRFIRVKAKASKTGPLEEIEYNSGKVWFNRSTYKSRQSTLPGYNINLDINGQAAAYKN